MDVVCHKLVGDEDKGEGDRQQWQQAVAHTHLYPSIRDTQSASVSCTQKAGIILHAKNVRDNASELSVNGSSAQGSEQQSHDKGRVMTLRLLARGPRLSKLQLPDVLMPDICIA